MVDRIRYPTVSYLPFYYVFFQFLLLTIFNLQANILTTKDILSNLVCSQPHVAVTVTDDTLFDTRELYYGSVSQSLLNYSYNVLNGNSCVYFNNNKQYLKS